MIPRLKPYLGWREFRAALAFGKKAVSDFENEFARTFETKYALAFPYGRSGLYALLKSQGIIGAEIIMPAYTCVVVPHAVVTSGNIPRFLDISLDDFNMDLELLENAITEKTKVIIPTSLFGYPVNTSRLSEILNRVGRNILVIHDCAHSFGSTFQGKLVCNQGDAAFFGLGISKIITSIFGGMVTTDNPQIYESLRKFRDSHFFPQGWGKSFGRLLYLFSAFSALLNPLYRLVNILEEKTSFLDYFTKYYKEEIIDMPKDYLDRMTEIEARVGLEQLIKYPEILRQRRETAVYYDQNLQSIKNKVKLPPLIEGATYSHYVVRVKDRVKTVESLNRKGIQLGWLIEYSIPEMPVYKKFRAGEYPNAGLCSETTVNLPCYPGLTVKQKGNIVEKFTDLFI